MFMDVPFFKITEIYEYCICKCYYSK